MTDDLTAAEREQFLATVDKALFAFGADGQALVDMVSLPVGNPIIEVHEFPLSILARACRAAPAADWERVCRDIVHRWAHNDDQRHWIAAQPFADVAGELRPWLSHKREVLFTSPPDDPEQPWALELLPGCWLSLFVEVLSLGEDLDPLPEYVPNKAVAAWGVSQEDLVEAVRARLRSQPPPKWESDIFGDHELWFVEHPEELDRPIPAAWQLILDEVAPRPLVPGTFITAPARQALLLSYPDAALTTGQRREVIDWVGGHLWGVYPESRVQGGNLRVGDDGLWYTVED